MIHPPYFALPIVTLALALLTGCQNQNPIASSSKPEKPIAAAMQSAFSASGRKSLDLAIAVPRPWERVCILGPYTDNTAAAKLLGFPWDVKAQSAVGMNDGIALLLFVQGQQVVSQVDYPRTAGDFANLTQRCFTRSQAKFQVKPSPENWPTLVPVTVPVGAP
jgi:hypothetical protein